MKFDKVKLLSLSPAIYDSDINFYQDNKLMYSTENGLYFIDSTHKPINNNYVEKILGSSSIDSLENVLAPTPEIDTDYAKVCLDVFWDAVVFFYHDKPVAHIDICFTCDETEFHPFAEYMNHFNVIGKVEKLRQFFLQNGIRVSGPPPTPDTPPPPAPKDSSHIQ